MNNLTDSGPVRLPLALLILFILALLLRATGAECAKKPAGNGSYAINLASYRKPVDPSGLVRLKVFSRYRLYTTRYSEGNRQWYRLRLGFFPDASSATRVMKSLGRQYPEAWVTRVTRGERSRSKGLRISFGPKPRIKKPPATKPRITRKAKTAKPLTLSPKLPGGGGGEERLGSIMEGAQAAMASGKYRLAASLYTKVLEYGTHKYSAEARELLGLAYEKSLRPAHARAEYRAYLGLYPKGEGALRVRQRLAGLETARAEPRKKLRARRTKRDSYEVYGSFSQFFNRDESYTDLGGNELTASTVANDFDINFRKRSAAYEMNGVLIAGYGLDLFHTSESTGSLSRLYFDILDRRRHLSARLGRQSRSTGGVLGRFDGALVSYQYFSRVKFNLVAGFPLETSELQAIDTGRYFYGVSADIGTIADRWDFNAFFVEQYNAGVVDRRAIGAEARYYEPGRSFFSLIDYDISYKVLNNLLLVGNWRLKDSTMINTSFDYRKTPTLSTTNALQGQTATASFKELLGAYAEDEVRSLARDRTAISRSFMIGATRALDKKLQLSADITVTKLNATPASGGADAGEGTGYEFFYTVQLVGNGIIKPTDAAIAGLKYSDTDTAKTLSLNLNSRYPVSRSIRLNPRLRFDISRLRASGADEFKARPSLRADWYWKRDFRFEFEGGMEVAYARLSGLTEKSTDYFLRMGYRAEF